MSFVSFKNLIGFSLTESETKEIRHPYAEVYTHVTGKSIQAFGMIGALLVGPILAVVNADTRSLAGLHLETLKCGKYGVLIGLIAGPLLTYARLKSTGATSDAVYDRAYRLRSNRHQLRVDRGSIIGVLGGWALSSMLATCPITGALLGMSAGIISMAVYNNVFVKSEKKAKKEKAK